MTTTDPGSPSQEPGRYAARLQAFGYPTTPAEARVLERPRAWRVRGAALRIAGGLAVAPLLALVPPHAPWALGALGVGVLLARRRWQEDYTLVDLEGACPVCGAALRPPRGRLQHPHPVTCEACHHQATLRVDGLDSPPGPSSG